MGYGVPQGTNNIASTTIVSAGMILVLGEQRKVLIRIKGKQGQEMMVIGVMRK